MFLVKTVLDAQKNPVSRERLIERSIPTICRYASKAAGRWVDQHDDLYAEAMIAFHDAIIAYTPEKGAFSPFAAKVIANRITDCLRREKRHDHVLPFSALETENDRGETVAFDPEDPGSQGMELAAEIAMVKLRLEQFDIDFFELPAVSPKAKKTKKACVDVVRFLCRDGKLAEQLYQRKKLPVQQILKNVAVNEKVLERHRKYIIAGVVICREECDGVAEYFTGGEKL